MLKKILVMPRPEIPRKSNHVTQILYLSCLINVRIVIEMMTW